MLLLGKIITQINAGENKYVAILKNKDGEKKEHEVNTFKCKKEKRKIILITKYQKNRLIYCKNAENL